MFVLRELLGIMATKPSGLQLCDVIQCNYCGQKHTAIRGDTTDVDSVKEMLYVVCTKPKTNLYCIGSIGGQSNRGPIVRRRPT